MSHSLKITNDKLIEQMLRLLWRQWSAVGVAGTAKIDDHCVIDPEALLLISTEFARHDSRLFDEILDWLIQNGNLINLKRVFSIRKQYPLGNPDILLAISKKLRARSSNIKWRSVSKTSIHHSKDSVFTNEPASDLIPLFPKIPYNKELLNSADMDFREKGYYRPAYKPRGMSQPPSPENPCNLIFKMRSFFGCNSRAEIMTWLLTHPSGHPAQIARDTHYFNKSVQATLNEMAASGHVHAYRSKREKHFRILKDEWSFFYNSHHQATDPPQWIQWTKIFSAIQILHQTLNQPGIDNASELFQTVQLRSAFEQANIPLDFTTTSHKIGADFIHSLLDDFARLLG
jgi:hypothetical protein